MTAQELMDALKKALGDWEASDEEQAKFAADEGAKMDAAWSDIFGAAVNSFTVPADSGNMSMDEDDAEDTPLLGG